MLKKLLLWSVAVAIAGTIGLADLSRTALAAEFPSKPVNLWVGFRAGGSTDAVARVLAKPLGRILGQPVVVVNKPGGGGALCAAALKTADSSGHTMCFTTNSNFTFTPQYQKVDFGFDDFTYIARVAVWQLAYVARSDTGLKTWGDLIARAKEKGEIAYGSNTPIERLIMAHVAKKEGITIKSVPFKGGSAIMSAILGNHIDFGSSGGTFFPHVDAGKMTVLATTHSKRLREFPGKPTLLDLGYSYPLDLWMAVAAPKGVPAATVKKLGDAFEQAVKAPEYRQLVEKKIRLDVNFAGPEAIAKELMQEDQSYRALIKALKK